MGRFGGAAHSLRISPTRSGCLSEDLPAGVALQWARWGRHHHYIVDDEGKPVRRHFESFTAPILAYSIDDDGYAPKGAVESLMSFFSNAARERRHVCPSDLGVESIGHFGFFQERFAPLFWQESVDWFGEFASPGAGWRGNKKGCQL